MASAGDGIYGGDSFFDPLPDDNSGVLSYIRSTPDTSAAGLSVGQSLYAQGWYPDPASLGGAGLTDALHFIVLP